MRLFRRRDHEAAATPDAEGPAIGAPAAGTDDGIDDGVARASKQPTGDWMTVAPMTPSFSPSMPTTFRVQTLPEILTSHRDTRLSSSLGHAVSSDAPSGSVGGLATHAGDVSHSSGMGSLELREPANPAPPVDAPALEVRRLADPAPISTSSPAGLASTPAIAPRLPEPTVSRSLLDTAPLAARPAAERPLPVARVVDAPAASAAAASPSPAPAFLSSEPGPADDAPLAGSDDRVGGFGVADDDGPEPFGGFGAVADDAPRTTAPPELAPPIQPRRVQRRLDGALAAPPPRPTTPAAPLLGETPSATSVDAAVPEPPTTARPGGAGEMPLAHPTPNVPVANVSRLADPAALAGGRSTSASSEDTDLADAPSAGGSGELPLHAAAAAPPVQRLADTGASPPPETPSLAGDGAGVAPLAAPLATSLPTSTITASSTTIGGRGELPLHAPSMQPPVQRLADTGAGPAAMTATAPPADAADAASTTAATDGDVDDEPPASTTTTTTTSTLGADAQPLVSVQPMAEGAGAPTSAPSPGTASLPLAPTDVGGTLQPPAPRAPADDVPRSPEASSASSPLVAPMRTSTTAAAPSVQRLATTSSPSAPSPAAPSGATTTLPFVRPMSVLASPVTARAELPVQLRRLDTPIPRLDDGSSPAPVDPSSNGQGAADLPLHTPAASVPSAADVAVRAGLAERGPDGSLFTTAPPATTSFTVQREADDPGLAVQTERTSVIGAHRGAAAPTRAFSSGPAKATATDDDDDDGGEAKGKGKDAGADAKNLAAEARKLYPYIRSALEADMRRQLEGKSRADRFRP